MVARVLYGLCSFLAVLRVDDDFADAFRNRDQAIAANAASAPHLEFSVTKLGDGNGFLEAFREAQNIAGWLAADPHRGVSDQAECQLRLAQRRMVAFLARCWRSEEHTSELQSLMRISYAVFCLKKKNNDTYILKK